MVNTGTNLFHLKKLYQVHILSVGGGLKFEKQTSGIYLSRHFHGFRSFLRCL